jgi:hypothetical protein
VERKRIRDLYGPQKTEVEEENYVEDIQRGLEKTEEDEF